MKTNQTFNSYYLEMGATEGFLKGEIKTLVDKLRDKEEEIKKLKSDLAFKNTMLDNVRAEYESLQNFIKKLKEDNRFLTKISKEYMEKENIVEVAEFTELYKDDLEKENKKLNERIRFLEQCLDNKEKVNKSLREDNKKLKNSIEYRKKKADKNQEKANQIDKIMNLPGVMVDGKIDWSKVAVYYMM